MTCLLQGPRRASSGSTLADDSCIIRTQTTVLMDQLKKELNGEDTPIELHMITEAILSRLRGLEANL
ncbi:hypothetical protein Leryth_009524 [Lithospermum erythrorhizon]|nr:hypothetical protein Leryth_009524 [Lithospermum erythrorhizon]